MWVIVLENEPSSLDGGHGMWCDIQCHRVASALDKGLWCRGSHCSTKCCITALMAASLDSKGFLVSDISSLSQNTWRANNLRVAEIKRKRTKMPGVRVQEITQSRVNAGWVHRLDTCFLFHVGLSRANVDAFLQPTNWGNVQHFQHMHSH